MQPEYSISMKGVNDYNRQKAVKYAYEFAYKRNPVFTDFSDMGGNCTNFVNQCLLAGGMTMNFNYPFGWFYKSINSRSPSFRGVEYLYNFLTRLDYTKGPFAKVIELKDTQIGDIIQFRQDQPKFTHSLIITKLNEFDYDNPFVTTNTSDVADKPLKDYYFNECRCLGVVGGRK